MECSTAFMKAQNDIHCTKELWTHYLRCAFEFSRIFLVSGAKLGAKDLRKCSTLYTEDSAGGLLILITTLSLFWKTLALRNDPSEQILVCFKIAHDVLGVCCPGTELLMKLKYSLSNALASVRNQTLNFSADHHRAPRRSKSARASPTNASTRTPSLSPPAKRGVDDAGMSCLASCFASFLD
jgi:hypothetical protein